MFDFHSSFAQYKSGSGGGVWQLQSPGNPHVPVVDGEVVVVVVVEVDVEEEVVDEEVVSGGIEQISI